MEKPVFHYGNEQQFEEFIKAAKGKKMAIISHTDLDGVASAKIVNQITEADIIRFVGYQEINVSLAEELRKERVKVVICTDLMIKDEGFVKRLEQFADVLIIDHHPPMKDFNSSNCLFMNAQYYCAAYLCYYLFSRFGNLEEFDWMVACAALSDYAYSKNEEWMTKTYEKYGEHFSGGQTAVQRGKFWEAQLQISLALIYFEPDFRKVYDALGERFRGVKDLGVYARRVLLEVDSCVERFKREKRPIEDGYFWEFSSRFRVDALVSNIASMSFQDKTIIIGVPREGRYNISARRQDRKIDMGRFLQKITHGLSGADAGGHIAAAGAHIMLRDADEFRKRLMSHRTTSPDVAG